MALGEVGVELGEGAVAEPDAAPPFQKPGDGVQRVVGVAGLDGEAVLGGEVGFYVGV